MEISVIIPAYNEERSIVKTVASVTDYLRKHFSSFEVIVVDDGSTDTTSRAVSEMIYVTVIRYMPNRGKGYAVKKGVLASSGDVILFMDADNSTTIDELDHCMSEIKKYDIVIGSRALAASNVKVPQRFLKRSLGRLANVIIRLMLGLPIHDTQCGFKLFRSSTKDVFRKQKIERFGFDFEILFLAHQKGYTIYETPVTWVNHFDTRTSPLSYLTTFVELLKVRLWYLFRRY